MIKIILRALAAVAVLVGIWIAWVDHLRLRDRTDSAVVCRSIPVGLGTKEIEQFIRKERDVRFVGSDTAHGFIVALAGPAYCYCNVSMHESKSQNATEICHH